MLTRKVVMVAGSLNLPSSSFKLYPSGLLSLSLIFHSFTVLSENKPLHTAQLQYTSLKEAKHDEKKNWEKEANKKVGSGKCCSRWDTIWHTAGKDPAPTENVNRSHTIWTWGDVWCHWKAWLFPIVPTIFY